MKQMKAFLGLSEMGEEGFSDALTFWRAGWHAVSSHLRRRHNNCVGSLHWISDFLMSAEESQLPEGQKGSLLMPARSDMEGKTKALAGFTTALPSQCPNLLAGATSDCRMTSKVCWRDISLDAARTGPHYPEHWDKTSIETGDASHEVD